MILFSDSVFDFVNCFGRDQVDKHGDTLFDVELIGECFGCRIERQPEFGSKLDEFVYLVIQVDCKGLGPVL